jgi:hypothetical protein
LYYQQRVTSNSPFACFKTIDGIELVRRYADGNGTISTELLSLTYTDIANLAYVIAPATSPDNGHDNIGSGTQWYADWISTDDTCKNDGNAPSYMVKNAAAWLFASRQDCCKSLHMIYLSQCSTVSNSLWHPTLK